MGSNYFGEPNYLGNERSSSSSGSSRKSKKNNSEKQNKQPQRGLGVAQLEKIRLHSEMGCSNYNLPSSLHNNPYTTNLTQEEMRLQTTYSSSPSFSYSSSSSPAYGFPGQQGIMMGLSGIEGANIRYGDSQPTSIASTWHPGTVYEPQHYAHPNMTRHLHNVQVEDSMERRRKKDRSDSIGSSSQNSESNGCQELDLELRLSL
ncbi:PREDICTED: protein SPEAR3-like [Nicotiana attenuata]|uniref:protein SPEAR3-like n=1 Tax=Nicotiana attenuata TaxID=49451 RepID=UPI000904E37B|nr:PREDICTED: protein SPEAR3-like [Nicotiana attenuata]